MKISEWVRSSELYPKIALPYGIYGPSESGKTTLIEELIAGLKERGFKVASIKHTQGNISLDEQGKDTWRHRKAGAELTVFSSPVETAYLKGSTEELSEILRSISRLSDFDIVLVEGFRDATIPKIAVGEFNAGGKLESDAVLQYGENKEEILDHLTRKIKIHRIAVKLPGLNCGDCEFESCWEMAKAIHEGEKNLEDCEHVRSQGLTLQVNGKDIPLSGFPSRIIQETIMGMVNALKGVTNPKHVILNIKKKKSKER